MAAQKGSSVTKHLWLLTSNYYLTAVKGAGRLFIKILYSALAAFLLVGTAPWLRAGDGQYELKLGKLEKTTIQYYSLLAETMQPIDSSIGYDNTEAFLTTTGESSTGVTCYIGQLDLPHGARIVAVRGYGPDTDSKREFYFRLYRYSLYHEPVWEGVTNFAH